MCGGGIFILFFMSHFWLVWRSVLPNLHTVTICTVCVCVPCWFLVVPLSHWVYKQQLWLHSNQVWNVTELLFASHFLEIRAEPSVGLDPNGLEVKRSAVSACSRVVKEFKWPSAVNVKRTKFLINFIGNELKSTPVILTWSFCRLYIEYCFL